MRPTWKAPPEIVAPPFDDVFYHVFVLVREQRQTTRFNRRANSVVSTLTTPFS
jgi:hypothetical protein